MTPSPHAALIARLTAELAQHDTLWNEPDKQIWTNVSRITVGDMRVILAALADAPVPPTHDYFAHAPHAVLDAPVPPATAGETAALAASPPPLSKPPLTLHYSGAASASFWEAINALDTGPLYTLGCALQDLEQRTLGETNRAALPTPAPQGEPT